MKTEHLKAKAWRQRHGWTLDKLSELTGYSVSAIIWMERGQASSMSKGKPRPLNPYAWQRYRRVCHSVAVEQTNAKTFEW